MTSKIDKLKHLCNIVVLKVIIYNIQWEECSCLKGIRLEDVTEELEDKATASDYTHLFGYLNPYYRSAYNILKRRK